MFLPQCGTCPAHLERRALSTFLVSFCLPRVRYRFVSLPAFISGIFFGGETFDYSLPWKTEFRCRWKWFFSGWNYLTLPRMGPDVRQSVSRNSTDSERIIVIISIDRASKSQKKRRVFSSMHTLQTSHISVHCPVSIRLAEHVKLAYSFTCGVIILIARTL